MFLWLNKYFNQKILHRLFHSYVKQHFFKLLLALILSFGVAGGTAAIAWLLDPAVKKIFIDGEVGTTGLEIRQRLSGRNDIEILSGDIRDANYCKTITIKFINTINCGKSIM